MSHAEICPICRGSGKVPIPETTETNYCYGCGGKGWITVDDNYNPIWVPTYLPYYTYYSSNSTNHYDHT